MMIVIGFFIRRFLVHH